MNNKDKWPLGTRLIFGGFVASFGIFPALATFDIGPLGPEDINGPIWIGVAAGGVFILAGLAVMFKGTIMESVFAFLILISFAVMATWIGFGAGDRVCGVSFGDIFSTPMLNVGDLLCRIPFGYGAILINALIFIIIAGQLHDMSHDSGITAFILKTTKVIMVIALLPLLLPIFIPMVARALPGALREKRATGKWPGMNRQTGDRNKLRDMFNEKFHK